MPDESGIESILAELAKPDEQFAKRNEDQKLLLTTQVVLAGRIEVARIVRLPPRSGSEQDLLHWTVFGHDSLHRAVHDVAQSVSMLIECSHCRARVDGKVIGKVKRLFGTDFDDPTVSGGVRVSLVECPSCGSALVGQENLEHYEARDPEDHSLELWSEAKRVWPSPQAGFDISIPEKIRLSLMEARKCLQSGAYTASVAMTGRALEAIARHFHTKGKGDKLMLGAGLLELHKDGVIDERLYQ